MLDVKFIRENTDLVKAGLAAKKVDVDLSALLTLDKKRRELTAQTDELRSQKNAANDEISKVIQQKGDPKAKIAAMKKIASQIDELDPQIKDVDAKLKDVLIGIPNLAHDSVPVGGADKNETVRSWGEPQQFDFEPKTHLELAEKLDLIDFKRAAKISGSNFILYKGLGAKLERALINFMLDLHTEKNGYTEFFPPFLVNSASMTGHRPTAQDERRYV